MLHWYVKAAEKPQVQSVLTPQSPVTPTYLRYIMKQDMDKIYLWLGIIQVLGTGKEMDLPWNGKEISGLER